ncbi:MAG: zf-HC2 domain-containing protein [Capsulimonadaceae bacterium]|nr:zf-HC2 domain-containing protein [Capsulimonadaceae bacterium]
MSMTCDQVRELQSNYIDHELIDPMRERVDQHLATCPACRADFATVAQLVARLRGQPASEDAAPWFTDRVIERLARDNDTTDLSSLADDPTQLAFRDL